MTSREIGLYLSRIVSGLLFLEMDGRAYILKPPTLQQRYLAESIASQIYEKAMAEDLPKETDLILIDNRIWTEQMEKDFEALPKDIEELSIAVYNAKSYSEREMFRNNLHKFRARQDELYAIKRSLDHMTAEGIAAMARYKFLLGCSIYIDERPFWKNPLKDYRLGKKSQIIDKLMLLIGRHRITQAQYRDLALSDVWLGMWRNAKLAGKGVFNCASSEMTDEQRTICSWANLYDNVWQDPDHPPDYIISDHDALDGWLILRKQKQAEENIKKKYNLDDPKFANADEVYFMANDAESLKEISSLNSPQAKNAKQQRFDLIKKKGKVIDAEFGDNAQKLMIARAKGPK